MLSNNIKEPLYVITSYANPLRWKNRAATQEAFEKQMLAVPEVRLVTVECAYGARPFELDNTPGIIRVQVRAKTILWIKENLLNVAIQHLPPDWKYVAWIDGDVTFRKPTWASDTLHALQQYDIIQPWSDAYDLGPKDEHLQHHVSFCKQYCLGKPVVPLDKNWWKFNNGPYDYPHSGYAWAATRQTIEWVGGLIETAISGAGDHHMAMSLINKAQYSFPGGVTHGYKQPILLWQQRAVYHLNYNIGFLYGTIEHTWHGRKVDRKYVDRWKIIVDNQFDPATDLKKNTFGVYELAGNKPRLTREIDQYFKSRNEDVNSVD